MNILSRHSPRLLAGNPYGQGRQQAPPTFLIVFLLLASPVSAVPTVLLSAQTLQPGQTLRVEVDNVAPDRKLKIQFNKKTYPCYAVGPNAQRALIGIKLGTDPGRFPLEIREAAASGGSWVETMTITISSRVYPTENVNFTRVKSALMKSEAAESKLIRSKNGRLVAEQYWEGSFLSPVKGPLITPYGLHRLRNGRIDAGFHKGLDLKAPEGEPVMASNAGVVELSASLRAHGKTILLNHGQGVMTIYLHMSSLLVKPGQKVEKGQIIGKVGSTGLSTAPHVHWQVYVHSVPVDPGPWMTTEY